LRKAGERDRLKSEVVHKSDDPLGCLVQLKPVPESTHGSVPSNVDGRN
jgi:hypothetical protein